MCHKDLHLDHQPFLFVKTKGLYMTWLLFALMTVVCWGLYGVSLHTGQLSMGDPLNGRNGLLNAICGYPQLLKLATVPPVQWCQSSGGKWQHSFL